MGEGKLWQEYSEKKCVWNYGYNNSIVIDKFLTQYFFSKQNEKEMENKDD